MGRRSPAVTTALGRAILAFRGADRSVVAGYAGAAGDGFAIDTERVWGVPEQARAGGYATEHEENEVGISCVAVPLLRSQVAVAAVSITAPSERITPERITWLQERIQDVLPPLLPAGSRCPPPNACGQLPATTSRLAVSAEA